MLLKGWRKSTLQQYNVYLKKWIIFCEQNKQKPLKRNKFLVLKFLKRLFKLNYSYSAINTARSALSVLFDNPSIGESTLVTRFMKAVYNLRPNLPKYHDTWEVSTVLRYLQSLSPVRFLSLQQLSMKLATLLALTTAQRIQTIHALNLKHCVFKDNYVMFSVQSILKHSNPNNKTSNCFTIHAFDKNRKICPVFLLKYYIKRTEKLRQDDQLFINNQNPHNATSKETISRWIKLCLQKAGINTKKYTTHSTRSASTSAAAAASVDITTIMKAAKWSNASTFTKHYNRQVAEESFSAAVLQTL